MINNALLHNPQDEILCSEFNIPIKRKDMNTLKGLNWLNDEVGHILLKLK